jgi:hypothetical protein
VVAAGEVDDLAVIGSGAPGHLACLYPKICAAATCARTHGG